MRKKDLPETVFDFFHIFRQPSPLLVHQVPLQDRKRPARLTSRTGCRLLGLRNECLMRREEPLLPNIHQIALLGVAEDKLDKAYDPIEEPVSERGYEHSQ